MGLNSGIRNEKPPVVRALRDALVQPAELLFVLFVPRPAASKVEVGSVTTMATAGFDAFLLAGFFLTMVLPTFILVPLFERCFVGATCAGGPSASTRVP